MTNQLRILCCALTGLTLTACPRPPAPDVTPTLALELVADGFVHPLTLVEAPDASGRLFVLDQIGKIWIIDADREKLAEPFLDVTDRLGELNDAYDERGLLGLAFHPDFANNGRFYVFYTAPLREQAPADFDHTNVIAEYRVSEDDPNRADHESERRLLELDHPYGNHNGGTLAFGPDKMLYIALGDGGNRDDQDRDGIQGHVEDWYDGNGGGNGQDIEANLLGSILRIDVGSVVEQDEQGQAPPYTVPDDNPFVDVPGVLPEIWAYGFRNPYRFAFDPEGAHALIVGDVGQEAFEEISLVTRGGNYGWNVYEGAHCFNAESPSAPLPSCPTEVGASSPDAGAPLIPPVIELKNSRVFADEGLGVAVVGGVVNRGSALPATSDGRYFFGMWSGGGDVKGTLLVATMAADGTWPWAPVRLADASEGELDAYLLGFGQDLAGDVYVLTSEDVGPTGTSGKARRLVLAADNP